jgi:sarcosine oxidase
MLDVVVVGLGIMGAAALYELARRGFRVLGIERFYLGHDRGSSHGETRIIRLGYFEHPSYVPLLRRAYRLWRELEQISGERLMRVTGIAEIGPPDGVLVSGTLAASRRHGLPHEVLDATECMQRFPAFHVPSDFAAVVQPDGGYLAVERSVETLVTLARSNGAQVRTNVRVLSVTPHGPGVVVRTGDGEIEARAAIVAAGAWINELVDLPDPPRATREVIGWFTPLDPRPFARESFPVFILETRHGMHYGFPLSRRGTLKIAKHHHRDETTFPDQPQRPMGSHDETLIRTALADHIPAANGPLAASQTCLYTVTRDHDFIIDRLPHAPQIVVASPCSGHGFKFAPVIGEIVADLALEGETAHDIRRFRLGRFR